MVGCPGSGKSTIRTTISDLDNVKDKGNLFVFSPDDKTKIKEYKSKINKSNIIIDSTNPSFKHRSKYYDDLKPNLYNFLIIHFNIDKLICKHLNHCRYHKTLNQDNFALSNLAMSKSATNSLNHQVLVPEIAYRVYYKNYEDPNLDHSTIEDDYEIKVINISNIKAIIDPQKITSECYMLYDID